MSINEAKSLRRQTITPEQRKAMDAAALGLPSREYMNDGLTHEEVERMRMLVLEHDKGGKLQEFDLNKPPRLPYHYQPFPKMIYHHERNAWRVVQNQDELEAWQARGWTQEPLPQDPAPQKPEEQLDPQAAAEAAAIDEQLRRKRSTTK